MDLLRRSLDILLERQHPGGAFPAAYGFPVYDYCWLRDATYVAHALDRAGQTEAAGRYYAWAARTVLAHAGKVQSLREYQARGEVPPPDAFLHTRYTLAGKEGEEPWGNFQLDGYGAYLWGLGEHRRLSGKEAGPAEVQAAGLIRDYLLDFWDTPCLDCWEESWGRHPATLAAVAGGLLAVDSWLPDPRTQACVEAIRSFLETECTREGRFTKAAGDGRADGSLLWLSVPFGLYPPAHPLMAGTVGRIEEELLDPPAGVHRYRGDRFYGGGQWVLLSAWLGWYYLRAGRWEDARRQLRWVEAQADACGFLPEQVPEGLDYPAEYQRWRAAWGEIARPLLWSHAMYVILRLGLAES